MVVASFEHDGNVGQLYIKTHFGREYLIDCSKSNDEIFRLGGTAINDVAIYEGLVTDLPSPSGGPGYCQFKAFRTPEDTFEGHALMSPEEWSAADLHCYITEFYPIHMEGQPHQWLVTKYPLKDANHLFVNLDVIDGGGNLMARYRVSPFTGEYTLLKNDAIVETSWGKLINV